ncbi:MAG: prepilin-type N-terminal cleavage/methylation domain-containing protein [Cyanosarcina radialis HA8281-LM2]|jgi:competence protein ComGC|nr:prepilin-type N-terminal cleavage/methylation domain-containing protein [Cyanosarcina radialis HA8281-LM2]
MKKFLTKISRIFRGRRKSAGLTLVELLVALVISTLVVILAGSAIAMVTSVNQEAQQKIERLIDLSRAFDFMSQEIRTARRINSTETTVADGNSISVANVVANAGINLTSLGNYGTIVLYLEVPITSSVPATCPAGGPNAGAAPPSPTDFDPVVYDIRTSPTSWLGPRIVSRYGRIPSEDGSIDPCSNPVSSDILVDAIADTDMNPAPTCNSPAVLVGNGGFYACVNGGLVDLYMRSKVGDLKTHSLSSKAFSRLGNSNTISAPALSGARQTGGDNMTLSWTWNGSGSPTFKLYRSVAGGQGTEIYSGSNSSNTSLLSGSTGETNCYVATATVGSYTSPYSNEICEPR